VPAASWRNTTAVLDQAARQAHRHLRIVRNGAGCEIERAAARHVGRGAAGELRVGRVCDLLELEGGTERIPHGQA
jgi:hypothetical protein